MHKKRVDRSNDKLYPNDMKIILACILRTYRICTLTVGFSKYEFNNKLLSDVILLKVTPSVTLSKVTLLNIF